MSIFGHKTYASLKGANAKQSAYNKAYSIERYSTIKKQAKLDAKYGGSGKRKVAELNKKLRNDLQPKKSKLTLTISRPSNAPNMWR